MDKWKCSVCKHIIESEERPNNCPSCKGGGHKFKSLFKLSNKKRMFELMD